MAVLPRKKKSWSEKLLDNKDFPRIEKITPKMSKRWGATGTVVIPKPIEVDELMRRIPEGKLTTINEIRKALAAKHGAAICCPITAGIFANIAAHAAFEKKQRGAQDITPYWRTLKSDGTINPKFPGGVEAQKQLLGKEGHYPIKKGKNNYRITDYKQHLAAL